MSKELNLTKSKRNLNIVLATMFFIFAIIQLNDPDPIIWFSIYLVVALISIISNYKKIPVYIVWTLIIGYLLYAGLHFYYFIDWVQTEQKDEIFGEMVYEKPYLEGTREFIGLVMAAGALLYQVDKRKKS